MPAAVLLAKFVRDARTVQLEVKGPWWPVPVWDREKADDVAENQAVFESLRAALLALGFKEVDE